MLAPFCFISYSTCMYRYPGKEIQNFWYTIASYTWWISISSTFSISAIVLATFIMLSIDLLEYSLVFNKFSKYSLIWSFKCIYSFISFEFIFPLYFSADPYLSTCLSIHLFIVSFTFPISYFSFLGLRYLGKFTLNLIWNLSSIDWSIFALCLVISSGLQVHLIFVPSFPHGQGFIRPMILKATGESIYVDPFALLSIKSLIVVNIFFGYWFISSKSKEE